MLPNMDLPAPYPPYRSPENECRSFRILPQRRALSMPVSGSTRTCPSIPRRSFQPGTARANIAASAEHCDGTKENDWAARHQHQTVNSFLPTTETHTQRLTISTTHQVLQQHVSFFDADQDGIIWPSDTLRGFNLVLSFLAVLVLHFNFS